MALGKKKDKDRELSAAAAAPPPIEEEEDESGGLFDLSSPEADDDAPVGAVAIDEDGDTRTADDPAPAGGDALLNMFQTTQAETEDRSILLDLAGDVEMDDLLEELHTMATALGLGVESQAA